MAVPKTTIYEDRNLMVFEDDIWFAKQPGIVDPEPETLLAKEIPDDLFRFCIPPPDPTHVVTAYFSGVNVGHSAI
jgi:hypothetical protein